MLSKARFTEIFDIKCNGDAGVAFHPDYAAIKEAERRFVDVPIIEHHLATGEYPDKLVFPHPRNEIEAATQWVASSWLQELLGRPVAIHYTTPPIKPPKRVAHAFRVARRKLFRRTSDTTMRA